MSEQPVPPAGGQCDCDRVPDYLLYAFVASTIVLFILILCLAVAVAVLYRKGKPIAPEQSLRHTWWKRRRPSDVVTNSTLLEVARELRREIDHLRRHELGHDLWSQPQPHGHRWSDGEIRAAFERFDVNRSGKLDYNELRPALQHLGVRSDSQEALRVLVAYDRNGDGLLSLAEFAELVHRMEGSAAMQSSQPAPDYPRPAPDYPLPEVRVMRHGAHRELEPYSWRGDGRPEYNHAPSPTRGPYWPAQPTPGDAPGSPARAGLYDSPSRPAPLPRDWLSPQGASSLLDALVGRDGGGGAKASPSQFPSPKPNARLDYDVPLRHSDYGAEARLDVRNPTGYASAYPYPSDYRLEGLAPLPPLRDKALGYQPDVPLREQAASDLRRSGAVAPGSGRVDVALGRYRIRSCGHSGAKQPPHWGLCALRFKGASEQAAPPPVDLSTGVAAWRMPKKRGKYHAGAAPKTAPHPLWHKPDHGSWIGSAKEDWPAGATEFTVSFEVHDPSQAHFALQHSADSKVASASLNGKPLAVGRNLGFSKFGGEMALVAPQGKGLFVRGKNTLSVVVDNGALDSGSATALSHKATSPAGKHGFSTAKAIGQKPHPLGLYVKGSVTVGGRVAVPGDGIRDAHSTWACLHEGDTWPHEWLVEPGSQPGTYRIRTAGHAPSKQPAGWGLAAYRLSATDGVRNGSSSYVAVHEDPKWSQDWYFEAGSRPKTYTIRTAGHPPSKQPAGWGLSAFRFSDKDGVRNAQSTWLSVHDGDAWPHDWILEPVRD